MRRLPPVVGLALAFGSGAALIHAGAEVSWALLLGWAVACLVCAWRRPIPRSRRRWLCVLLALAAGTLHAAAWARARDSDCRLGLDQGEAIEVRGWIVSSRSGRATIEAEGPACAAPMTLRPADPSVRLNVGTCVEASGRWVRYGRPGRDPRWSGEVRVEDAREAPDCRSAWALERRTALVERVERLFPARHGLVAALVLADRDGLDADVREAFARAGTAHMLAISGFHVGVIAGLVIAALRLAWLRRRPAALAGAGLVWAYVVFIGAPDAAVRAALMLTLVGWGAARGRPVHHSGAVAGAFLLLVWLDAGALARVGFQLSFAGAFGLAVLGPALGRALAASGLERFPGLRRGLAAGLAATLCTLPIVAWHFDRVSLVGIPATLFSAPLVSVAVPGALVALFLEPLASGPAHFLAGGVDVLLGALQVATHALSEMPGVVFWVPRSWIFAAGVGGALALVILPAGGVQPLVRGGVVLAGGAAAILLLPAGERLASTSTLDLVFFDVGQGDAIGLRTGGQWMLVDAGPPGRDDPPVGAALRARGVRRVAAVILSHPDLDHIGGAAWVLDRIGTGVVLDPGRARGSGPYADLLAVAAAQNVSWRGARVGDSLALGDVAIEVLHPPAARGVSGDDLETNEGSVVVHLRFGAFSALLTGDAPVAVEDVAGRLTGPVTLLKVGHHGSATSTSQAFLESVRPEVAVVSVGRRNRYGHPDRAVLERLRSAVPALFRTDVHGTVSVRARADGSFSVRTEYGATPPT